MCVVKIYHIFHRYRFIGLEHIEVTKKSKDKKSRGLMLVYKKSPNYKKFFFFTNFISLNSCMKIATFGNITLSCENDDTDEKMMMMRGWVHLKSVCYSNSAHSL